jgi:Fic family protein
VKLPQPPPQAGKLLREAADSGRLPDIVRRLGDFLAVPEEYYHWEELRFRPPPQELSSEDWWLLIKLWRQAQFQPLPLADMRGQPFRWVAWHSIAETLHRIDTGLGGTIHAPEPLSHPAMRDRYLIRSLIEEAITSSQLEGAVATREVARQMIRTGRPPRNQSEQMILNNYRTMQHIREVRAERLTPALVLELHRKITAETLENPGAAGRLRTQDERVRVEDTYGQIFFEPPPAEQLGHRLAGMCDFANGRSPSRFLHPALRAILLHFWLAYDHPFVDGNGRVARALFYWSMLRSGYWLCEFISISRVILKAPVQYYKAFLYTETDDNDVTYFLLHQLGVILQAVKDLQGYIDQQMQRMQALRARLRGIDSLNHRQRALIEHALAHATADYTIEGHEVRHNVVYQTARTDLLDLQKRGLLTSHKVGRTFHFRPAGDLDKKLSATP